MLKILPFKKSESDQALIELSQLFPQVVFKVYRSDDATNFITCFVSIFQSAADCVEQWESVNSSVVMLAQGIMEGYAAPWNLYLIIVTPDHLPRDVKYKIENDRFAARKITIASGELPTGVPDAYNVAVENIILGNDMHLSQEKPKAAKIIIGEDSYIRKFLQSHPGTIPQDRKPASGELRKNYINELLNLTMKS